MSTLAAEGLVAGLLILSFTTVGILMAVLVMFRYTKPNKANEIASLDVDC